MSATGTDAAFSRARAIIADSLAAALVDGMLERSLAAARGSHVFVAVQRRIHAWQRMSHVEQRQSILVVIATAVVAHAALASWLPAAAKPQVALTTLVLIALGLAVFASAVRRQ